MGSNQEGELLNPDRNSQTITNTDNQDFMSGVQSGEGSASFASCSSEQRSIDARINREETMMIERLRTEKNLNSLLAKYLSKLYSFEVVIVCDDSGSMKAPVDNTEKTRWDELCEIVKRILAIAIMFDANGVDLHFLNGEEYLKIKNPADVDHAFKRKPTGYTPLVPVLQKIFQSKLARHGRDKKLLVFVATDGKPTDDNDDDNVEELEYLMRYTRDQETTYVSFLLCSDEQECVDYLETWDRTMKHVDVTDDYNTELRKIRKCQKDDNYPFSYDDYIVKALIGSIVPHIDRLNETEVEPAATTENT